MDSLAKQNYRSELRELDWDFSGQVGNLGFARYHWYPARFVPQVPGILIAYMTEPGQWVLDPFCGSGTTLIEARRQGRKAVGIDTNPIATMMTRSKLVSFAEDRYATYVAALFQQAERLLIEDSARHGSSSTLLQSVPNLDEQMLWYHDRTLRELAAIWQAIAQGDHEFSEVAQAAFSAILRFVCSQEKHWGWICDNVRPKDMIHRDAMSAFAAKLNEFAAFAREFPSGGSQPFEFAVHTDPCDKALRSYDDHTFDFVMTSPPYFGVTDYIRSQRLTFMWLDLDLNSARSLETGARYKRHRRTALSDYIEELRDSFREVARVLKPKHHCAVVVGESPRRTSYVKEFEQLLADSGLIIEERIARQLPRQRALSPQLLTERIILCRRG